MHGAFVSRIYYEADIYGIKKTGEYGEYLF